MVVVARDELKELATFDDVEIGCVVAVLVPPLTTEPVLLACVMGPDAAPGLAIPAFPRGWYIGVSSPSTTLAQPVGRAQAALLAVEVTVMPVALHPVTVE